MEAQSDPLGVLCRLAQDETLDSQLRIQAAVGVAPYLFPRLSAAVVATVPASAKHDNAALMDRLMQRFARIAQAVPSTPCNPASVTIEGEAVPGVSA